MTFTLDITGARKKLRQAEFFLAHARDTSEHARLDYAEHFEFYISACMTAAQSVYYVLDEPGPGQRKFHAVQKDWRAGLTEVSENLFGRMIGLRDDDVHRATRIGTQLQKYVPAPENTAGPRPISHPSFGPRSEIEAQNPDGRRVVSKALVGTIGFYIEHQGRQIDALDACQTFIDLLKALVEKVEIAATQVHS